MLVDDGERVTKGQIVAHLDTREALAGVTALEVQLKDRTVRAKLAELAVDSAVHSQQSARIERNRLQAELDRLKAQDPDDISRHAMEDAQFAVAAAEEVLNVAGFDHRKAELDKDAADNAIEEAQARLDEAKSKLDDHDIVSPLNGTVIQVRTKGGEAVSTTTELLEVVDLSNLVTYVSRPQIQLPLVREAKTVVFTADAYAGREFIADVDVVSPVVDQATGHFKLRARVRAEDVSALRPGMFIRARILTEDLRPRRSWCRSRRCWRRESSRSCSQCAKAWPSRWFSTPVFENRHPHRVPQPRRRWPESRATSVVVAGTRGPTKTRPQVEVSDGIGEPMSSGTPTSERSFFSFTATRPVAISMVDRRHRWCSVFVGLSQAAGQPAARHLLPHRHDPHVLSRAPAPRTSRSASANGSRSRSR